MLNNVYLYAYCMDDYEIFREHQNCNEEELISNLCMIGTISLILDKCFNYITTKINEIIYFMPCKQISGSQTE